jgi:hemerythrin-like metal-binding protein
MKVGWAELNPRTELEDVVPALNWDPAYETGVAEIDHQHRELLSQMDRLLEAIAGGSGVRETERTLLHLGEYIETHFSTEEVLMEISDYNGLDRHRGLHDEMRAQVASLVSTYQMNPAAVPAGVMAFLSSWLVDHLSGEDRLMAEHLRKSNQA